jgi:hypothetical protein
MTKTRVIGWRVWHVEKRKWCFGGQEWATRKEAERAKINATRGRRNTLTNFFRIAARIVPILSDGTSPLRDAAQKDWDSKHVDNEPTPKKALKLTDRHA